MKDSSGNGFAGKTRGYRENRSKEPPGGPLVCRGEVLAQNSIVKSPGKKIGGDATAKKGAKTGDSAMLPQVRGAAACDCEGDCVCDGDAPPAGGGVAVSEGDCVGDAVGEAVTVGDGVVVDVGMPVDVGVPVGEPVLVDEAEGGGDGHSPGTFVGRAIVSEITLHDDGLLHEPTWFWSGK